MFLITRKKFIDMKNVLLRLGLQPILSIICYLNSDSNISDVLFEVFLPLKFRPFFLIKGTVFNTFRDISIKNSFCSLKSKFFCRQKQKLIDVLQ
jgi:hypothetical protein